MKKIIYFTSVLLFPSYSLHAQENVGFGFYQPDRTIPCVTLEQHEAIENEISRSRAELQRKGILSDTQGREFTTYFEWPLAHNNGLDDYGYHGISNFIDQNAEYPNLILDYQCGNRSYDLSSGYNHAGTDMYTWPFSWYKMDHNQVKVIAAAAGTIVYKSDGNYDRNCGFNNNNWNAVYIQHADGSVAWYGHLKNGSTIGKQVGEAVATGEYLGIVGSSGNSTGPHLHFEIYNGSGNLIDPYSGSCNSLNSESWWVDQRPYYDSGLNALRTHSEPAIFPVCPETETINEKNQFCGGDVVYYTAYYRDQLPKQDANYKVYRPNNSIYQQWTQTFDAFYSSSWWYWWYTLPQAPPTGTWTFEIAYEGETYERFFDVIGSTSITASGNTTFCEGNSVTLSAPLGHYGFQYQWEKDGNEIAGANSSTFIVSESGDYTCVVSIPNSCSSNSNTIVVNVEDTPQVIVTADGPFEFCDGESITLTSSNGSAYLWSNGETTQSISVEDGGNYSLTVTNNSGCSGISEIHPVTVYPLPTVDLGDPILFLDGADTLLNAGGNALTYLWSNGETSSSIFVDSDGIYSVTVTDINGCTASDEVEIVTTSSTADLAELYGITIYPNPVENLLNISSKSLPIGLIRMYDSLGRLMIEDGAYSADNTFIALKVESFSPGLYYLFFKNSAFQGRVKVLKW
ncbi:MAG: peptidoglycan DD-metalloendopeptidase family protein [Saprospiraceae bacterium]|mgnify:CR=1 FL=1|nr:peptidoglycan DD-metalloendopeptidase family protein [Saprospiraceae bacterium]